MAYLSCSAGSILDQIRDEIKLDKFYSRNRFADEDQSFDDATADYEYDYTYDYSS